MVEVPSESVLGKRKHREAQQDREEARENEADKAEAD